MNTAGPPRQRDRKGAQGPHRGFARAGGAGAVQGRGRAGRGARSGSAGGRRPRRFSDGERGWRAGGGGGITHRPSCSGRGRRRQRQRRRQQQFVGRRRYAYKDVNPAGCYCATGHSCWGILNGPATGKALAELITDGEVSCLDLRPFAPMRRQARGISCWTPPTTDLFSEEMAIKIATLQMCKEWWCHLFCRSPLIHGGL
jgi:hypothetical protein